MYSRQWFTGKFINNLQMQQRKGRVAKETFCNAPLQISVYRVVSKELSLRGQLAARGNLPEKGYDFYLSLVKCERFSQEIPTAPLGPRNDILNQLVINCSINSNLVDHVFCNRPVLFTTARVEYRSCAYSHEMFPGTAVATAICPLHNPNRRLTLRCLERKDPPRSYV